MELEIMLSEISQTEKNKNHVFFHMYSLDLKKIKNQKKSNQNKK
jgi:hypothetical protein